ncbi:hypothetical protein RI578_42210 (plasmid) [Streptomyces sp. BB1-1-1]|uniref:hypothetical protein n=1 Tax=Streptomyces sp. BB1-1-1 TaxID=3074430 RepID=UPI0028774C62|nr:hypothetical protein [Streptomyces sp. BB1-1-1]WND32871.1 hypothetical protein RI578_00425 [Streptomyces sp. BB1-1-1]WND40060.1 hypothetical protein RI578_39980 [Streptomyces sp. BB1-1-1]WND40895.1 hypothetical protein RI578_42210 [Streptomyces sp. BB1-1-1]
MISDAHPAGPPVGATLTECQELTGAFRRRVNMPVTADVALLDASAELGELAGAYLKNCGYAPSATSTPPSDQVRSEFGDVLFALFGFADAAGLDAGAEFAATLDRYEARFSGRTAERHG